MQVASQSPFIFAQHSRSTSQIGIMQGVGRALGQAARRSKKQVGHRLASRRLAQAPLVAGALGPECGMHAARVLGASHSRDTTCGRGLHSSFVEISDNIGLRASADVASVNAEALNLLPTAPSDVWYHTAML